MEFSQRIKEFNAHYTRQVTSSTKTVDNDPKRDVELHPSSFPYCGVRHFYEVAKSPPQKTSEMEFGMDYYVNIGSVFHSVIQEHLGRKGKMLGHRFCPKCRITKKFTRRRNCERCGTSMRYDEIGFRIWKRTVGHMDGVFRCSDGKYIAIDYKGLALDTLIPTPSGWTTMGKLKVGTKVFDSKGNICRVTSKSAIHKRKCYRIIFDDGSSVVCDDEHLWVTTSGYDLARSETSVKDTESIKRTLKKGGKCHHRVAVAQQLKLPDVDLPIHPYVLGCWLGDGTASSGVISKPDKELFDNIKACGYKISANKEKRPAHCPMHEVLGLREQLKSNGLLRNKHIPEVYLRASRKQRLQLLQGLMDTDGSWNSTRHQAVFSSCDLSLSKQVRELACSLGVRAIVNHARAKGFGKVVDVHQVTFRPINGLNPFWLSRKASKVTQGQSPRTKYRIVKAVVPVKAVATQCIQVDSADRTYLCTEAMIPTHNTSSVKALTAYRGRGSYLPYQSNIEQIQAYCFHPDTFVLTESGFLRMKELVSMPNAPRIASLNHTSGEVEYKPMVAGSEHSTTEDMYEIEYDGGVLRVTENHEVWSVTRNAYVKAKDLREAEDILAVKPSTNLSATTPVDVVKRMNARAIYEKDLDLVARAVTRPKLFLHRLKKLARMRHIR